MCDDAPQQQKKSGSTEKLDELRQRHRAVARYRVYSCDRKGEVSVEKTVATHLNWDEATALSNKLQAEVIAAAGPKWSSWTGTLYHIELENGEEVRQKLGIPTQEERRERALALVRSASV